MEKTRYELRRAPKGARSATSLKARGLLPSDPGIAELLRLVIVAFFPTSVTTCVYLLRATKRRQQRPPHVCLDNLLCLRPKRSKSRIFSSDRLFWSTEKSPSIFKHDDYLICWPFSSKLQMSLSAYLSCICTCKLAASYSCWFQSFWIAEGHYVKL